MRAAKAPLGHVKRQQCRDSAAAAAAAPATAAELC